MLFYRCKGSGWGLLSPHPRRLRYDNVGGFVVDGCRLAHALFGKQNVHDYASLGERPNLVGVLNHHVVERERLTIRELSGHLLGKRLVELSRLRRCLGLCGVLLENVELMGNLAGEVLGRVLLGVIVVPQRGLDDLGRDIARNAHQSGEHLIVGELKFSASGSHELTPSVPETRASRRSALFSLPPLDNYYYALIAIAWQELIYKYGGIMETPGKWGSFFRISN